MSSKLDSYIKEAEEAIQKIEDYKRKIGDKDTDVNQLNKNFNKGKINNEDYKTKLSEFKDRFSAKEKNEIKKYLDHLKKINDNIADLFKLKENIKEGAGIENKKIKDFVKRLKKKKIIDEKNYSTYTYNFLGKYSNLLFDEFSKGITVKYPNYFKPLYYNLRLANIRVFSNTYINLGFMISFVTFIFAFVAGLFLFKGFSALKFIQVTAFSLFALIITILIFYYYPKVIVDSRKREIKNDLPFAILHVAAVAGSGAKLIDIFSMLLQGRLQQPCAGWQMA